MQEQCLVPAFVSFRKNFSFSVHLEKGRFLGVMAPLFGLEGMVVGYRDLCLKRALFSGELDGEGLV